MAQVFCSGCFNVFDESAIRILPRFNADAGAYVTTYRCQTCAPGSFAETRARLNAVEDEFELASAAIFFQRHGITLLEFGRGDSTEAVRSLLVQLLDKLEAREIQLSIGPTRPL